MQYSSPHINRQQAVRAYLQALHHVLLPAVSRHQDDGQHEGWVALTHDAHHIVAADGRRECREADEGGMQSGRRGHVCISIPTPSGQPRRTAPFHRHRRSP